MSERTIRHPGLFVGGEAQPRESGKVEATDTISVGPAPVGYRWASKRWRVLPDGTRDYAIFHGQTEFPFLLPVSAKLRSPRR